MTSHEVTIKAGITYRQLDHWTRAGYIPGNRRLVDRGSGTPRFWTRAECAFVTRLAQLERAGINIRIAAEAIEAQTVDGRIPDALQLPGGVDVTIRVRHPQSVSA